MKNKKWYATGAIAIVFAIGCGSSDPSEDDVKRLNDAAKAISESSTAKPVDTKITAGTWKVAKNDNLAAKVISPGLYVITSPAEGLGCYYEALKNFDGDFNAIRTNGNVAAGTVERLNVKPTDKGLKLQYDCLATKEK